MAAPNRQLQLTNSEIKEFLEAAESGDVKRVREYLAAGYPPDAMITDEVGAGYNEYWKITALIKAAIYGRADVARLLIKAGANLEIPRWTGDTALVTACSSRFNDSPEVARILIRAGANTNVRDQVHQTVWQLIDKKPQFRKVLRKKWWMFWRVN